MAELLRRCHQREAPWEAGAVGFCFFPRYDPNLILQTLPRSQSSVVPLPSKILRFDFMFMSGDCIRKLRVVQKTCDEIKLKKE